MGLNTNISNKKPIRNISPTRCQIFSKKACLFLQCSKPLFLFWLVIAFFLCLGYSLLIFFSFLDQTHWIPDPQNIPKTNKPLLYEIEFQGDVADHEPLSTFSGNVTLTFQCTDDCSNYFYINKGDQLSHDQFHFCLQGSNESLKVVGHKYNKLNEIQTLVLNKPFEMGLNYTFSYSFRGDLRYSIYGKLFSYTGLLTSKTFGMYFSVPEDITKGLRYLVPSLDEEDDFFASHFKWSILRRSSMRSFSNAWMNVSHFFDSLYFKDQFSTTIKMKTYENLIVIYKCNYEKELNPFSSTIINSCFRNTITDKFISIDRVNQFMCEESNEIGKMDAIVIAGSPTIFRPGIGILNEGETIQEAKTLDNTNKGSLKK